MTEEYMPYFLFMLVMIPLFVLAVSARLSASITLHMGAKNKYAKILIFLFTSTLISIVIFLTLI